MFLITGPVDCQTPGLKGRDYTGTTTTTENGYTCLDWVNLYDDASNFPDASLDDAANYCRNPDESELTWCYNTTDKDWDYCDIPDCGKCYEIARHWKLINQSYNNYPDVLD